MPTFSFDPSPSAAGDPEVQAVADLIARYLEQNPVARDSEEGIARWWLGEQGAEPSVVRAALILLEHQGVLRRVIRPNGTVSFARRPPAGA